MAEKPRVRCPFRKHQLRALPRESFTPAKDKTEGTAVANRGYHPGSNYTPDEVEFIRAVEEFQKKSGRKFLSHVDYQRIALTLGYRRPTTPPSGATPMTADSILRRMVAVGFTFSRAADGSVSFTPPPEADDCPERQHLLGVVAWSWGWLAAHAERFVTDTTEPAPAGSALTR